MKIVIEIGTSNAAFGSTAEEVAIELHRILVELAVKIRERPQTYIATANTPVDFAHLPNRIYDINGNVVGTLKCVGVT